jgi:hypothetical protein|tara:strand:+ start:29 stop:307 length:279 start_codon:yes stop_codon:yes gene_type:complete
MKTKIFKTAKELVEFVREFEERPDKTLDISYFKLTVVLRTKQENRSIDQESDKYTYRDMGGQDSFSLMKSAEKNQRPSDTKWMLRVPITIIK